MHRVLAKGGGEERVALEGGGGEPRGSLGVVGGVRLTKRGDEGREEFLRGRGPGGLVGGGAPSASAAVRGPPVVAVGVGPGGRGRVVQREADGTEERERGEAGDVANGLARGIRRLFAAQEDVGGHGEGGRAVVVVVVGDRGEDALDGGVADGAVGGASVGGGRGGGAAGGGVARDASGAARGGGRAGVGEAAGRAAGDEVREAASVGSLGEAAAEEGGEVGVGGGEVVGAESGRLAAGLDLGEARRRAEVVAGRAGEVDELGGGLRAEEDLPEHGLEGGVPRGDVGEVVHRGEPAPLGLGDGPRRAAGRRPGGPLAARVAREVALPAPRPATPVRDAHHQQELDAARPGEAVPDDPDRAERRADDDAARELAREHARAQPRRHRRLYRLPRARPHAARLERRHAPQLLRPSAAVRPPPPPTRRGPARARPRVRHLMEVAVPAPLAAAARREVAPPPPVPLRLDPGPHPRRDSQLARVPEPRVQFRQPRRARGALRRQRAGRLPVRRVLLAAARRRRLLLRREVAPVPARLLATHLRLHRSLCLSVLSVLSLCLSPPTTRRRRPGHPRCGRGRRRRRRNWAAVRHALRKRASWLRGRHCFDSVEGAAESK
mmetsp:Transcript_19137/g.60173  ORF Transcript_19137/g.60173 Transcript_19137/m.60173 type:complete len:610 (+) Transcript_19137:275-2104(+)